MLLPLLRERNLTQFLKEIGLVKENVMPYRINPSFANQFYHIYNRGNNRGNIFFERKNYHYFLRTISEKFHGTIYLIAYCLMPNHYHLVVNIITDGALEKAMQKISTAILLRSYTRAINKAYGRSGHLFSGRYKNKIIPGDNYLLHLCRYVHLNPCRAGIVKKPGDWEFSSYSAYLSKSLGTIVEKTILMEYFKTTNSFIEFHDSYQEEQNYYVNELLFK